SQLVTFAAQGGRNLNSLCQVAMEQFLLVSLQRVELLLQSRYLLEPSSSRFERRGNQDEKCNRGQDDQITGDHIPRPPRLGAESAEHKGGEDQHAKNNLPEKWVVHEYSLQG